jgi:CDP-4-dehydro-6-deoxyglucose reductase
VRRRAGDPFAERVFGGLKGVDAVRIEGPRGEFVLNEESHRPLVFIAGEAGFAPIKSLIEHAMALDAAESLHLYWAAAGTGGQYLDNLCRSWGDALDNFRYDAIALARAAPEDEAAQAVVRRVLQDHAPLAECDVYVAGPAPWAGAVEFQLLERGLPRAQLAVSALEA